MKKSLFAAVPLLAAMTAAVISPAPAVAEDRAVVLVLDASGSMRARLPDGATRMDAAKAAVADLVGTLAPGTRLSLLAYGHQSPTTAKNCEDTAVLVPFGNVADNKAEIVAKANAMKPLGYTPITRALTQAAEELAAEEATTHSVVLVSDGKETCKADPCAAAKALAEASAKLVVHTVGVGVDQVTRNQLQCIAKQARGNYFDANSAQELASVLGKAAVAEAAPKKEIVIKKKEEKKNVGKLKMETAGKAYMPFEILDATGTKVEEFSAPPAPKNEVELPPGIYSVKFGNGLWSGLEVRAGETTEIKPAYLEVKPIGKDFVYALEPETGETLADLLWVHTRVALIPGHVDVKFGNLLWPGGVELKPGETTTIRPGVVRVKYNLGGVIRFELKTPDGEKAHEGDTGGQEAISVPPGKYVLHLDPDKWSEHIPDDARVLEIELAEGQEQEIKFE